MPRYVEKLVLAALEVTIPAGGGNVGKLGSLRLSHHGTIMKARPDIARQSSVVLRQLVRSAGGELGDLPLDTSQTLHLIL